MAVNLKAPIRYNSRKAKQNKTPMSDVFRTQLEEDISLIQADWGHLDNHLKKRPYAFNYWVLSRIYNIDEEVIPGLITDYNDKSIDCFVHYEDSKELFIIQNKYYSEDTPLDRGAVNDFLQTPLICLSENRYKKSKELQRIFNAIKDDPEYTIYLHFYLSNNKRNYESDQSIKNFNINPVIKIKSPPRAEIKYFDDIRELYYGKSFQAKSNFKFRLKTKVAKNILRILPEEYNLPDMSKAFYLLTPVSQLYQMYKQSKEKGYPLFEENIREYLGENPINRGIISTLRDKTERKNFFYYNNGVTIIASRIEPVESNSIELFQPQIVNGCQTVNSIYEVLSDYQDSEIIADFQSTFVMVKVLLFDNKTESLKPNFYRDIVKYTNKQNSINESAFGARKALFDKIQNELKERGFLLLVKPSDKNSFKTNYSSDYETNKLLTKANESAQKIGLKFKKLSDIFIPLEKLLQVYLGLIKDGYYSYRKKDSLLKQSSDIYKDYSLKISETLTNDNLIRLWLIYLKAERRRNESDDKKTPIPYYIIGFLGRFIKNKDKLNSTLEGLFNNQNKMFDKLFSYLENLTTLYRNSYMKKYSTEYNNMVKKPIDEQILDEQIEVINVIQLDTELKRFFESLY
jgi:hypothetical protein